MTSIDELIQSERSKLQRIDALIADERGKHGRHMAGEQADRERYRQEVPYIPNTAIGTAPKETWLQKLRRSRAVERLIGPVTPPSLGDPTYKQAAPPIEKMMADEGVVRGSIESIKSLGQGLRAGVPELAAMGTEALGGAMRALDAQSRLPEHLAPSRAIPTTPQDSGAGLARAGEIIRDAGEDTYPPTEAAKQYEFLKTLHEGGKQAVPSMALGIGAGALAGPAAGALTAGSTFGLSEFSRSQDEALRYNLTPRERDAYSAVNALSEFGSEFIGDFIGLKAAGVGVNPLKSGLKDVAVRSVKEMLQRSGVKAAEAAAIIGITEQAEEAVNTVIQHANEKLMMEPRGKQVTPLSQKLADQIPTVAVSSLLFAGLGVGVGKVQQRAVFRALENPKASPQDRVQAVLAAGKAIEGMDPSDPMLTVVADQWMRRSMAEIEQGKPVSISTTFDELADSVLESESQQTKTAPPPPPAQTPGVVTPAMQSALTFIRQQEQERRQAEQDQAVRQSPQGAQGLASDLAAQEEAGMQDEARADNEFERSADRAEAAFQRKYPQQYQAVAQIAQGARGRDRLNYWNQQLQAMADNNRPTNAGPVAVPSDTQTQPRQPVQIDDPTGTMAQDEGEVGDVAKLIRYDPQTRDYTIAPEASDAELRAIAKAAQPMAQSQPRGAAALLVQRVEQELQRRYGRSTQAQVEALIRESEDMTPRRPQDDTPPPSPASLTPPPAAPTQVPPATPPGVSPVAPARGDQPVPGAAVTPANAGDSTATTVPTISTQEGVDPRETQEEVQGQETVAAPTTEQEFRADNGPFTVEYSTRASGAKTETFDDLDEAKAFAKKKEKSSDFVSIFDNDNNEMPVSQPDIGTIAPPVPASMPVSTAGAKAEGGVNPAATMLTIERQGKPPFDVNKGDNVTVWFDSGNKKVGKAVAVYKNGEVGVEFVGVRGPYTARFEQGKIYPADQSIEPSKKSIQSTVSVEKAPPGGWTESDKVTTPAAPSPVNSQQTLSSTNTQPATAQDSDTWDIINEELHDALDAFSPARSTGRIDYDLQDVATAFTDFARKDTTGKPIQELWKAFKDQSDASDSQLKKVRRALSDVMKARPELMKKNGADDFEFGENEAKEDEQPFDHEVDDSDYYGKSLTGKTGVINFLGNVPRNVFDLFFVAKDRKYARTILGAQLNVRHGGNVSNLGTVSLAYDWTPENEKIMRSIAAGGSSNDLQLESVTGEQLQAETREQKLKATRAEFEAAGKRVQQLRDRIKQSKDEFEKSALQDQLADEVKTLTAAKAAYEAAKTAGQGEQTDLMGIGGQAEKQYAAQKMNQKLQPKKAQQSTQEEPLLAGSKGVTPAIARKLLSFSYELQTWGGNKDTRGDLYREITGENIAKSKVTARMFEEMLLRELGIDFANMAGAQRSDAAHVKLKEISNHDNTKASRTQPQRTTRNTVYAQAVNRWIHERFGDNVPVVVVATLEDLPFVEQESVRAMIEQQGGDRPLAGFWDNGKVYIFADKVQSKADALGLVAHEVGIHEGLRSIIPAAELNKFLDRVWQYMTPQERADVQQRMDAPNLDPSNTADQRTMAEEHLAYAAQATGGKAATAWHRFAAWIKGLLRDMGLNAAWVNRFTEGDIRALATQGIEAAKRARATKTGNRSLGLDITVSADGDVAMSRSELSEMFFSYLRRTIERLPQDRFSPQQLKGILAKAPGVKQDELKWTGFNTWLDEKSADGKQVTKAEALAFLRENQITVTDSVRDKQGFDDARFDALSEAMDAGAATPEMEAEYHRMVRMAENLRDEPIQPQLGGTKFESYISRNFPTAEGYGEATLNLPAVKTDKLAAEQERLAQEITTALGPAVRPGGALYEYAAQATGNTDNMGPTLFGEMVRRAYGHIKGAATWYHPQFDRFIASKVSQDLADRYDEATRAKILHRDTGDFRVPSAHQYGDESDVNQVARIIYATVTLPDGRKGLVAAEIQGDWSQEARKHPTIAAVDKTWIPNFIGRGPDGIGQWNFAKDGKVVSGYGKTEDEARKNTAQSGTPDAPLIHKYHELATKWLLRKGAEMGMDFVGWNDGSVVAERYDLSKEVDKIKWAPVTPETTVGREGARISVTIYPKDATDFFVRTDASGAITHVGGYHADPNWIGRDLSEVIGKDIAKKVVAESQGELSGTGLKVGGKWAEALYDKMLPDFAKKYVKQWGGNVESVDGGGAPTWEVRSVEDGSVLDGFPTQAQAEQRKQETNDPSIWVVEEAPTGETPLPLHIIPINAAMKADVLTKGQPLFSRKTTIQTDAGQVTVYSPGKGSRVAPSTVDAVAELEAQISRDAREKKGKTAKEWLHDLYARFVNATESLEKLDPVLKTHVQRFRGIHNVAQAPLFDGTIRNNIAEGTWETSGEGLQAILDDAQKIGLTVTTIDQILVAERDIEKKDQGIETGIADGISERALAIIEERLGRNWGEAQRVIKRIRDWTDRAVIQPLLDIGYLSQDKADQIRRANEFYTPFFRVMDDIEADMASMGVVPAGKDKFQPKGKMLHRMEGSERQIISPLESLVNKAQQTAQFVGRLAGPTAMVRRMESGDNEILSNVIEEEIPPMVPVANVEVEAVRDAGLRRQLLEFAGKIGARVEKAVRIGHRALGYFKPDDLIKLKQIADEHVLAHEIGHRLDHMLDLQEKFLKYVDETDQRRITRGKRKGEQVEGDESRKTRKKINDELRDLADARKVNPRYGRKGEEKVAELIGAYVSSPDTARRLAPTAVAHLEKLIRSTPELEGLDQIHRSLELEVDKMKETIFRQSKFQPPGTFFVYKDGDRKYYKAPADILKALQGMGQSELHVALKLIGFPTRMLRAGATLSLEFIARNPFRDQLTAWTFSKYGYIPGWDLVKGIASMVGNDEFYQGFKAAGAGSANFFALDRKQGQATLAKVARQEGAKRFIQYANPITALRALSDTMEQGTRVGLYRKSIEKGATPAAAMNEARDTTLDFSRMGTEGKIINQLAAFWNANVQGLDKLRRELGPGAWKRNPKQAAGVAMRAMLGLTLPSVLLWMLNHDDDEYKEIPQWQKDYFWLFKVGGKWWRIPKPFDLGLIFGTSVEHLLDAAYQKDPSSITKLGSAVKLAGVESAIPTAALPLIENKANYSFFRDRNIVPRGMEDLPNEYQYSDYTSETAKIIGRKLGISPAKIDNLVRGYTAGLGGLGVQGIDKALNAAGVTDEPVSPTREASDIPMVKAFAVRDPMTSGNESTERFYDVYEKAVAAKRGLKVAIKNGETFEDYARKYPEIYVFAGMEKYADAFSRIRKARQATLSDRTMTADQKRARLKELGRLQTQLAQQAVGTSKEVLATKQ